MITFREAAAADKPALINLIVLLQDEEKIFEPIYLPGKEIAEEHVNEIIESINGKEGKVILALSNIEIIGLIGIWRNEELDDYLSEPKEICIITDLIVKKDLRDKGIGGMLVKEAEKYALGIGLNYIKVAVLSRNYRAKELYQKLGYRDYTTELVKKIIR